MDWHLSDYLVDALGRRIPPSHAAAHKSAGRDPIKLDELAAPTDVATLNVSSTAHGLAPKGPSDTGKFLRGDATPAWSVLPSVFDAASPSILPGGTKSLDGWVAAGIQTGSTATATVVTKDQLYAVPLLVNRKGAVIDRIAVPCTTGQTGGACKLGLYKAVSLTDPYPGAKIIAEAVTSSDLTTSGMKSVTVNQAITQGELYWVVANFTATSTAPSTYWSLVQRSMPVFGYDSTGAYMLVYVTFGLTYSSAWADPFNTGGSLVGTSVTGIPLIFVRFSA